VWHLRRGFTPCRGGKHHRRDSTVKASDLGRTAAFLKAPTPYHGGAVTPPGSMP
jgi:hypothetical protein